MPPPTHPLRPRVGQETVLSFPFPFELTALPPTWCSQTSRSPPRGCFQRKVPIINIDYLIPHRPNLLHISIPAYSLASRHLSTDDEPIYHVIPFLHVVGLIGPIDVIIPTDEVIDDSRTHIVHTHQVQQQSLRYEPIFPSAWVVQQRWWMWQYCLVSDTFYSSAATLTYYSYYYIRTQNTATHIHYSTHSHMQKKGHVKERLLRAKRLLTGGTGAVILMIGRLQIDPPVVQPRHRV